MSRFKDINWNCGDGDNPDSVNHAKLAVLMDIRDELKRLNQLLHCHNFTGIPMTLRSIRRAMPARKKKGAPR
jgi:hypothetical protein